MKKILLLGVVLSITYAGFSQSSSSQSETSVQNNSFMCKMYRFFIGDDSAGCGGGEMVCCANTSLNFH
ncbi:MAG TPA: hypothetical protein VKY32_02590 [Flavobacterium sp.]|nr:hypothetical protein [Flavobacterium sp.]